MGGGETVVGVYYISEESIFSKKNEKENKKYLKSYIREGELITFLFNESNIIIY